MDIVSSELPGSPTTRIQVSNKLPVSFSNGVLKRNHHNAFNSNNQSGGGEVFVYKECLKNHAASLGSHAVDGCGEFMPSPNCSSADPTSFKCAACGCHRNFHRREEPDDVLINNTPLLEYQPHHRHHPPPPPPPPQPQNGGGGGGDGGSHSSPSSESPPPISSSYYPSAPHLLLTLSGGGGGGGGMSQEQIITPVVAPAGYQSNGRKRFRTRFTSDQKGKMLELAEKLGWKMQRRDDGLINGVCNEIGVERGVFKVWMHNNKSNFGKNSCNSIPSSSGNNNNNTTNSGNNNNNSNTTMNHHGSLNEKENNNNNNNQQGNDGSFSGRVIGTNGSSTSS